MSLSPSTKETVLPPHSPFSSSQSHLSPRLLTPDSDHLTHHPPTPGFDSLSFAKQPIPRKPTSRTPSATRGSWGLTESEASDGHVSEVAQQPQSVPGGGGAGAKSGHLSLLTAILSSPDTVAPRNDPRKKPTQPPSTTGAGIISGSSNPSTTLSSPATREPHGILQNTKAEKVKGVDETIPPSSILRRESASASSDAGAVYSDASGLGSGVSAVANGVPEVNLLDGLVGKLQKIEEKRERIGWADDVQKPSPQPATLARIPSTGSSIGPRPRLQFAVAHPPSHGSTSASEAGDVVSRRTSSAATSSRRPSSPFAKERKVQESLDELNSDDDDEEENEEEEEEDEEEEELDGDTPGSGSGARMPGTSRSTSSSGRRSLELQSPIDEEDDDDLGYQEDEEDGMFSDEEETAAFDIPGDVVKRKFAFARPTNYFRGRRPDRNTTTDPISPGTTPPMVSAPTFFPPPNRRGRGHVRVADPELPVEKEKKGCTRHCSPPPNNRAANTKVEAAPPAVASPSARFLKRAEPNQAGPSKQRIVGSPMPPRVLVNDDEDEDEDEEQEENDDDGAEFKDVIEVDEGEDGKDVEVEEILDRSTPVARGGWRSDDAAFFPTSSRIPSRAIRPFDPSIRLTPSLVHSTAVFEEESDDGNSVAASMAQQATLDDIGGGGVRQWIRRASEQLPMFRRPSNATTPESRPSSRDASVSYTAPLPCQATCPPALDFTPVAGTSVLTDDGEGVVDRLGKTLSVNHGPIRDPTGTGTSPVESSSITPPAIPHQPLPTDTQAGLGRAVSSASNKVKFQSPDKPLRPNQSPSRAISGASHYLAEIKSRKEAERKEKAVGRSVSGISTSTITSGERVVPIKCPKRLCRKEDLGWSDEALMSIRKQVGKGVKTD